MNLAVVITAYRPGPEFLNLVQSLAGKDFAEVVVVDDGSGPESEELFASVAMVRGVRLLRHGVRLGRGASLKTAFNQVICQLPDVRGVVTASEFDDWVRFESQANPPLGSFTWIW